MEILQQYFPEAVADIIISLAFSNFIDLLKLHGDEKGLDAYVDSYFEKNADFYDRIDIRDINLTELLPFTKQIANHLIIDNYDLEYGIHETYRLTIYKYKKFYIILNYKKYGEYSSIVSVYYGTPNEFLETCLVYTKITPKLIFENPSGNDLRFVVNMLKEFYPDTWEKQLVEYVKQT